MIPVFYAIVALGSPIYHVIHFSFAGLASTVVAHWVSGHFPVGGVIVIRFAFLNDLDLSPCAVRWCKSYSELLRFWRTTSLF